MDQIDWQHLASDSLTGNCSGADLRNIVNDAAFMAVRDQSPKVNQSHLLHAIRRFRAMKVSLTAESNGIMFPFHVK